jgi:hypothetical protein
MRTEDDQDDQGDDYEPPPHSQRRAHRRPCPGCGRCREACWIMPCLYLAKLIENSDDKDPGVPSASLRAWAKAGGGRVLLRREA